MIRSLSLSLVLAVTAACAPAAPEPATARLALNDDLACQHEWQPPIPPPPGPCHVEITLDTITVTNGQGVSEGAFELSVDATASPGGSASWPSGDPANVAKDTLRTIGKVLGEITVPRRKSMTVSACATVTEFDSGLNGKDDGGSACTTLIVSCDANGMASATGADANVGICRGNKWSGGACTSAINAWATVTFSAKSIDADADGVPNQEDWAPDPCDDGNLGQRGRGVFIYVYAPAAPDFDLLERFKPPLKKATVDYDYIVLVRDPANYAALDLDPWVEKHANLVLDATVDNFFAGMRDIEQHGYDMDVLVWTTGYPDRFDASGLPDPNGGAIIEATDGNIDEATLRARMNPAVIGAHTVPIRIAYSSASWHAALDDAWLAVGAQAAAAPAGVSFEIQQWENFQDAWNASATFVDAVMGASTHWNAGASVNYVDGRGYDALLSAPLLPPGCSVSPGPTPSVSDGGPCASWYFEGNGPFDFLGTYDDALDGAQNEALASAHQPVGANPTKLAGITY